jgi:HD superfamily phosphohydrolase
MTAQRTQRLRDPVHGLIVFEGDQPVDQLAWALIGTPEFQRLRRIRQLGVAEFIFPSATHTRFAHSIGVFHTARKLIGIIRREVKNDAFQRDKSRAEVAAVAALLHDLGHGPFSHTFEGVQRSRSVGRRHEQWTAEIIRNEVGRIRPLLEAHRPNFTEEVATLISAEDPADIYHAVVSSSFDADRLDYLRRDRLMTGSGAGAIDFDWLMEHIRVRDIEIDAVDGDAPTDTVHVPTFCLDSKALPAAEQFLLARYTLHEQVYFHKATRCVEHMIARLLRLLAERVKTREEAPTMTGLPGDHPLLRFFGAEQASVEDYLALDDAVITAAFGAMRAALDVDIAKLATRLRNRDLYKTLDLRSFGEDPDNQTRRDKRIKRDFKEKIEAGTVIRDPDAAISIYTQIGGDDEKVHKKLHILDQAEGPREITKLSKMIETLQPKRQFTRYYFADEADRDAARQGRGGTR